MYSEELGRRLHLTIMWTQQLSNMGTGAVRLCGHTLILPPKPRVLYPQLFKNYFPHIWGLAVYTLCSTAILVESL